MSLIFLNVYTITDTKGYSRGREKFKPKYYMIDNAYLLCAGNSLSNVQNKNS